MTSANSSPARSSQTSSMNSYERMGVEVSELFTCMATTAIQKVGIDGSREQDECAWTAGPLLCRASSCAASLVLEFEKARHRVDEEEEYDENNGRATDVGEFGESAYARDA